MYTSNLMDSEYDYMRNVLLIKLFESPYYISFIFLLSLLLKIWKLQTFFFI